MDFFLKLRPRYAPLLGEGNRACRLLERIPRLVSWLLITTLMLTYEVKRVEGLDHETALVEVGTTLIRDTTNFSKALSNPCPTSGACSSRRLLQEDLLYRRIRAATLYHHKKKKHNIYTGFKLTGCIPRKDPLNHFRVYQGGFNVTDRHYWSSVTYTGIWGYVLACICLVACIILGFLYCCGCCARTYEEGVSGVQLIFVYFFCCVAIVAAAIIYWGNAKLGQQLRATAGTLVTATDGIQSEINNALSMVQVASMFPISRQGSSQQFLQACVNLGNTFNNLERKVKKNKDRVYKIFNDVKVALIVVSAVIAGVVVAGLVGTMTNLRILLWITFSLMTTLLFASWILAGISYALTNVANDACKVMNEYDDNPQNSSISKYLPCLTNTEANKALAGAKEAIKSLVTQANVAIDWVNREENRIASKKNVPPEFVLPRVCDPYGPPPMYSDTLCSSGETSFGDFEKVYAPYRCENDNLTHCFEVDTPIPNFAYIEADMAMNASNIVYKMLPTIFKIITCDFVKVTFEDILYHNCKPLKKSLTTLWAAFIAVSLAMIFLQMLWGLRLRSQRTGGSTTGFSAVKYLSPGNLLGRIGLTRFVGRALYAARGLLPRPQPSAWFRMAAARPPARPPSYPVVPLPSPPPSQSEPESRASTPAEASAVRQRQVVMPDGTPVTDFSIYGQGVRGSLGWIKRAISRASVFGNFGGATRDGPARPGSRAPTPRSPATTSRAGTPNAGVRLGTPTNDVAMPKPNITLGPGASTRNQGFG